MSRVYKSWYLYISLQLHDTNSLYWHTYNYSIIHFISYFSAKNQWKHPHLIERFNNNHISIKIHTTKIWNQELKDCKQLITTLCKIDASNVWSYWNQTLKVCFSALPFIIFSLKISAECSINLIFCPPIWRGRIVFTK